MPRFGSWKVEVFMNKHQISYMLEDTKLGLKRNKGSVTASVTLLFIALCLIGSLLLIRAYISEALDYVESQLAMKVYVEDGMAEGVAGVLEKQSYAKKVDIQTGEEMIAGLAFFFEGKEHLLEAFTDGSVPDAVKFYVEDQSYMKTISENLEGVNGIVKVVYPQQMAEILTGWVRMVEVYGTLVMVILFGVAFLMVYTTFHLAIYQRQRELKVKLFLGMDPKIVRAQFLLEGLILGVAGALLAIVVTSILYNVVFVNIQRAIPYLGQLTIVDLLVVCVVQLIGGIVLGLLASYFSTRKTIAYV